MMEVSLLIGEIVLCLSFFVALIRFVRGPDTLDRILAFDLMSVCIVGAVVIFSIQASSSVYLETLLIFSLLGFVTTVAFMDSLFRGRRKKTHD